MWIESSVAACKSGPCSYNLSAMSARGSKLSRCFRAGFHGRGVCIICLHQRAVWHCGGQAVSTRSHPDLCCGGQGGQQPGLSSRDVEDLYHHRLGRGTLGSFALPIMTSRCCLRCICEHACLQSRLPNNLFDHALTKFSTHLSAGAGGDWGRCRWGS